MKKSRTLLLACSLILAAAAPSGCGVSNEQPGAKACSAYITERQELKTYVTASGTVEGNDVISITSAIDSEVTKLNVSVGSIVKKGDVLCVFDDTELRREYDALKKKTESQSEQLQSQHSANERNISLAVSQKEIALNKAQRAIDEAVTQQTYAYKEFSELADSINSIAEIINSQSAQLQQEDDPGVRASYNDNLQKYESLSEKYRLLESKLVSYDNAVANARDDYRSTELTADAEINKAKEAFEADKYNDRSSDESSLEKLGEEIGKCVVTAPQDGIITSLSIKEGSIPSKESIMTLSDNSSLVINATVFETDILKIYEGQECEIKLNANSARLYSGKIESVSRIRSDNSSESAVYSVRISIRDADESVIIGMSTEINIITNSSSDAVAVPYDAIGSAGDENYVYVAEADGSGNYTVHMVSVDTGMETDYLTEITGDISYDEMVVFPIKNLRDGDTVSIKDTFTSEQYME